MKQKEREALLLEKMTLREKQCWAAGELAAGMDEVGRGPLAGPVVVCALILPADPLILGVNDSKKLSEKKRERLYGEIVEQAVCVGIGLRDEARIDDINILEATREAFHEAFYQLSHKPHRVLSDAISGLNLPVHLETYVGGDSKSYLIAAASIVAKVTRDHLMIDYASQYPEYGFERNKGYGTREHIEALRQFGPCPIHRKSFIRKFV